MREQMYRMCELTKPLDGGVARMVSWIRQEVAIPGRTLRKLVDPETGNVENGWTVATSAVPAMPERLLMVRSRDWKRQRAGSDI